MPPNSMLPEPGSGDWGSTTVHGRRTAVAEQPERPRERKHLAYAPGLDGVRALAVTAVVVFHLGATWLSGGFLGVDVFFTLSGFLITSILLTEFYGSSRIDIKNFYLRRARRAAPAARRRGRGVDLLHQLDADRLGPLVLRPARPAVPAAAPVVAGCGGAVLPAVAAGAGRLPGGAPPLDRARRAGRADGGV